MKRAAAYARVSTNKQSDTSIETQFEVIENFASNGGIKIVAKYSDKITASGEKERPAFSQMIEDALTKKFDMILVYKYDRFIRDEIEDQRLMKELEKKNVFVISCSERIDTSTPAGRLQRWIISGINRFYIENLRQEIYDKTTKVAEKGYYLGGKVPFGFALKEVKDPEAARNRKIFVINESEAAVVRKIFQMFASGHSYREIIRYLNDRNIRTRKGGKWTTGTISDMLKNEKYAGIYVYRKGTKKKPHVKREDTIKVVGGCPAIVEQSIFEKARERLEKGKRQYTKPKTTALCRGIVFCGVCGAPMTRNGSKNNQQYLCSRWKNRQDTQYVGIAIKKLDHFVLNHIKNTLLSDDIDFEEMARAYNAEMSLKDASVKEKIEELELKKQELEGKIQNAIEAVLNGSPLADILQEEAAKMREEVANIVVELKKIKEQGQIYITAEMLKEKYKRYKEMLYGVPQIQRQLVLELIDKVIVYPDSYIKIIEK